MTTKEFESLLSQFKYTWDGKIIRTMTGIPVGIALYDKSKQLFTVELK